MTGSTSAPARAARREFRLGADRTGLRSPEEAALIPGVGAHLARKIIEFRETGSCQELDELRARVPAGLRTLLVVPGPGPKRARQVYDELGITSVSELLDALHDQRLQSLRGWGQRSEENLALAIHDAQSSGGRIHLDVALDLANQLLGELIVLPIVRRAAYAGSLRQMRDTVGDIDLLVTSDQPAAVHGADDHPEGARAAAPAT